MTLERENILQNTNEDFGLRFEPTAAENNNLQYQWHGKSF